MPPTEPFENRFQERGQQVKASVEAAPAETMAEGFVLAEQFRRRLESPHEEVSGHNGGAHHFGVGDGSLRAFWVAAGAETIVGKAVCVMIAVSVSSS